MSNARLKVLVAVLMGVLTVASSYGLWEWGRDKNYWGTPDEVAALWDLSIVQAAEALPGGISDRSQRPNSEFMSKPEPAYIEFSVVDEAGGRTSDSMKKMAEEHGWTVMENCAENVRWCAQTSNAQGYQLFMTVSDDLMEMDEGGSGAAPQLRVRIFYL